MTPEEKAKALALLRELGIDLNAPKVKAAPKEQKEKPAIKPRHKIPAKEYNLRLVHECRLCGSVWNEDIRMVRADLDDSILVATEPEECFEPDKIENRFPRTCYFCREKLQHLNKDTLIKAAMSLSNRVENAEYVRHITKE